MNYVDVAGTDEVPPGRMKTVSLAGRLVVLYHTSSGYYASDDRCPHRGGPLVEGDLMGEEIVCPWHLWSFNVRTGEGPIGPEVCLRTHLVRVEDGRIFVNVSDSSDGR